MSQGDRPSKGQQIRSTVNTKKLGAKLTKEDRLKLKIEQKRKKLEDLKAKREEKDRIAAERLAKLKAKAAAPSTDDWLREDGPEPPPPPKSKRPRKPKADDDEDSTTQMITDLRWVIKQALSKGGKKGRERLLELVQNDDKLFVSIVKELAKVEASVATAEAKKKNERQGTATLVILKGLHDDGERREVSARGVDIRAVREGFDPTIERQERVADDRSGIRGPEDQA